VKHTCRWMTTIYLCMKASSFLCYKEEGGFEIG